MTSAITPGSRPTEQAWLDLANIVGSDRIRRAVPSDAICGVQPLYIVSPDDEARVSATLAWADQHFAQVVPFGGRTKQQWANPPRRIDLALSLERLNGILEHAWEDLTVTVQAGCTIQSVQDHLAKHRQRLALDLLWPATATVGGIVACNDGSALRLRYGSVRDIIIGATVVLANGTIARSGGKVVKNVAGYDLPKLFTGSMGTLGLLSEATFRVHPLPIDSRSITFSFADAAAANNFILGILGSTLVPASVQLRSDLTAPPRVDILLEGIQAGIEAQFQSLCALAGCSATESSPDTWTQRESIFKRTETAAVLKYSVLPSNIAAVTEALGACFAPFQSITQATGIGWANVSESSPERLAEAITRLAQKISALRGTLHVLDAPEEYKQKIDVFGAPKDSYPLMLRVKQHFDPNGILNAGRFAGGI